MLIVASLSRIDKPAARSLCPAVWPLAGSGPQPLLPAPVVTSAVPAGNYPAPVTHSNKASKDISPGSPGV